GRGSSIARHTAASAPAAVLRAGLHPPARGAMRTLAALLLLAACGDDHGKSPDAQMPDAAPPDACPTCRSFAMATGGVQIVLGSQPLFQITAANVNDDGDVAAVHQDFFGIPWDEFEAGNPPPPEWVAIFDLIQQHVAGKDV